MFLEEDLYPVFLWEKGKQDVWITGGDLYGWNSLKDESQRFLANSACFSRMNNSTEDRQKWLRHVRRNHFLYFRFVYLLLRNSQQTQHKTVYAGSVSYENDASRLTQKRSDRYRHRQKTWAYCALYLRNSWMRSWNDVSGLADIYVIPLAVYGTAIFHFSMSFYRQSASANIVR
jgi:hypothetical protein